MNGLKIRVAKLEAGAPGAAGTWHRLLWRAGQGFADMLAANGADAIDPRDNVVIREIVNPAGDPAHERDAGLYRDWIRDRDLTVAMTAKPA